MQRAKCLVHVGKPESHSIFETHDCLQLTRTTTTAVAKELKHEAEPAAAARGASCHRSLFHETYNEASNSPGDRPVAAWLGPAGSRETSAMTGALAKPSPLRPACCGDSTCTCMTIAVCSLASYHCCQGSQTNAKLASADVTADILVNCPGCTPELCRRVCL